MSYYKPLDNINAADTVLFKEIGAFDESMKYPAHQCRVTVNGEDMFWTLSKSKHDQLTKAGFKQGDTVLIQKWKEGVKSGYNFVSPDKSNPYAQPEQTEAGKAFDEQFAPPPFPEAPRVSTPPKDEFQEKMSRGASWNNAVALTIAGYGDKIDDITIKTFLETVAANAELIAPAQAAFVNKS